MRNEARALFRAAFAYYRNYAAHDGTRIRKTVAARIMVLASELLDLLDASSRSLEIEGGPEGLVDHGHFEEAGDFSRFLDFLDGRSYPEDTFDGLLESLATQGFDWDQIHLAKELGLVNERIVYPENDEYGEWITVFELTELGRQILESLR